MHRGVILSLVPCTLVVARVSGPRNLDPNELNARERNVEVYHYGKRPAARSATGGIVLDHFKNGMADHRADSLHFQVVCETNERAAIELAYGLGRTTRTTRR